MCVCSLDPWGGERNPKETAAESPRSINCVHITQVEWVKHPGTSPGQGVSTGRWDVVDLTLQEPWTPSKVTQLVHIGAEGNLQAMSELSTAQFTGEDKESGFSSSSPRSSPALVSLGALLHSTKDGMQPEHPWDIPSAQVPKNVSFTEHS